MNEVGGPKRQPFFFEGPEGGYLPEETRQMMEEKAYEHRWIH